MSPYLTFDIELGAAMEIGSTPSGHRRMVPLLGGTVSGAFAGIVLPGGSDWQLVLPNGTLEINARYLLKTEAEELIEVQSTGIRACQPETFALFDKGQEVAPELYYFRTAVRLFTAAPALMHLNNQLFACQGRRFPKAVRLFINPLS